MTQATLNFDGVTFVGEFDGERLAGQLERVRRLMEDGGWWTLAALARAAGCTEASASARIRDLRKPRFGGHVVERRREANACGLFAYRLVREAPGVHRYEGGTP